MRRCLWIVDLVCAAAGALLIWGFVSQRGFPANFTSYWSGWLVSLAMVLVPFTTWARTDKSTAVGEAASRYLAAAREVLRERRVWWLFGLVALGKTGSLIYEWGLAMSHGWNLGAAGGWNPDYANATVGGCLSAASWLLFGGSRGFGIVEPYLLGAVYLLALPSALSFLRDRKERPGWAFTRWVVVGLGFLVAFIGISLPWIGEVSLHRLTPLTLAVGLAGQLLHAAFWTVITLVVYNVVLRARTGRSVDWLAAFAGLYAFRICLFLISTVAYSPTYSIGGRRAMGGVVEAIITLNGVLDVSLIFVPALIATHGIGVVEALRRNYATWSQPGSVALFIAALAVVALPVAIVASLPIGMALKGSPLYCVLAGVGIPFQFLARVITLAALGVFVLENAPEVQAEGREAPGLTP